MLVIAPSTLLPSPLRALRPHGKAYNGTLLHVACVTLPTYIATSRVCLRLLQKKGTLAWRQES